MNLQGSIIVFNILFRYPLLLSFFLLFVASNVVAGNALTRAYLHDSNSVGLNLSQSRVSDRYTLTISGRDGIKPVRVYKSDNDIRSNDGDICLTGSHPFGECRSPDATEFDERLMTKSHHWSSFDYGHGFVTIRITTTCGGLTPENINGNDDRNRIVHPKKTPAWQTKYIDANTLELNLYQPTSKHWPRQFYVKLPGGECHDEHPLFIFANPLVTDEDPAKIGCPRNHQNTITYLGDPGYETVVDPYDYDGDGDPLTLKLGSESENSEICIPGGAYVNGRIVVQDARNVRITGRGILSGARFQHHFKGSWNGTQLIFAKDNSRSLRVEGITLTDAPRSNIESSKNLIVQNVKLLSWHINTDGISGTRNTDIDDVFLKVNDDGLKMTHSETTINNAVVWQQIAGSAVQLSWNNRQSAENASLKNLVLIGADSNQYPANKNFNASIIAARNLMSHNITNFRFEDIIAEVTPFSFMTLQLDEKFLPAYRSPTRQTQLCSDASGLRLTCDELDGNGRIENIRLKNIYVPALPAYRGPIDQTVETPSSYDLLEPDGIAGISLHNVFFGGKRLVTGDLSQVDTQTEVKWTSVFESIGGSPDIDTQQW